MGPTELSIEWPVWTHQRGDTGDPPIMWYSVWVRASTEAAFRMVGRALQIICGDVCNYTINSLTPNTEYAIYVSTKRDGDGGDGPPGPVFYETTRCAGEVFMPQQLVRIMGVSTGALEGIKPPLKIVYFMH